MVKSVRQLSTLVNWDRFVVIVAKHICHQICNSSMLAEGSNVCFAKQPLMYQLSISSISTTLANVWTNMNDQSSCLAPMNLWLQKNIAEYVYLKMMTWIYIYSFLLILHTSFLSLQDNKPSKPPTFIFVIDVSYNNIKSGLVHLLCAEMKRILRNLPIDQGHSRSAMRVGFITYNNTVHFYNVKAHLAQPQMMVVGDVHEMFMPLLDGFFCDPIESESVIDALMEQIPLMFGQTRETETILLPAIQAGLEAIKVSECAGKLLVFHSSLPIADAPGKLQNREDRKLLGTEKEKTILSPQNTTYNNLGQDCVLAGCSVDLFIFNNSYIDLATIGQVARLTGGEVYKYTYFQADIDGPRLINDVIKNISRPIGFDTVMRVRTSAGIRPTDFYGHFFMSNTTDLEIAAIDCDKSIGIEIKHDDKLPPEENVYIQVALLYTSCSGQRRLRILNLALKTCVQMADLFRCCDLDAMVLYFSKQVSIAYIQFTNRSYPLKFLVATFYQYYLRIRKY